MTPQQIKKFRKNLLNWFQINQPVFPKKNKEQWESSLAIKPYNKGPKDPTIDTIAKYKVMGTTKINGKECLIIDSHISFKEIIKGKSRNNEIELVDTATTFFDYKAGRVIKMDIDYHYKITAIDGDTRLVIRDEKATLKHELSDREFTPGQLNAWLYNIVPELPIEE